MLSRKTNRSVLAGLASVSVRRRAASPTVAAFSKPCLHQVVIVDGFDTPDPLPPVIARNIQAARSAHPAATHRLWNGHQLRAFLEQRFDRDVLAAFDALTPYSYKCDLARFCLLYELGGYYVDLGVRLTAAWTIPPGRRMAAFRDLPFITSSWSAMQTGLLWACPGQREFALAINMILGNVRARYYGNGPLHPTGPVLLGKAMLAARVERGWDEPDPQHVGACRLLTPGADTPNMAYVSPEGELIALRTKTVPGDVEHLGLTQGNNYNQLWRTRRAYGEREWNWEVDHAELPRSAPDDPTESLRLQPPPVLLQGAYEASWIARGASAGADRAVWVRSSQGGDGAIDGKPTRGPDPEVITPFVVVRGEDAIECGLDTSAGRAGSLTIREATSRHWSAHDPAIRIARGIRTRSGIALTGADRGLISFGPYATLFKGRYQLDVSFADVEGSAAGVVKVEICANAATHRLAAASTALATLAATGMLSLSFECVTDMRHVEFRVVARRRARAVLTGFSLVRLA